MMKINLSIKLNCLHINLKRSNFLCISTKLIKNKPAGNHRNKSCSFLEASCTFSTPRSQSKNIMELFNILNCRNATISLIKPASPLQNKLQEILRNMWKLIKIVKIVLFQTNDSKILEYYM